MKNVMIKLKMSLTNNWGIKITAVIVAAIVWLAVVNVSDPEKTIIIYNVPITMTNEETITDMGMVYNLETKNSVNITVSGKRSIVSNLTADDFTATASLAELSQVNAIPVEVTANSNSIGRKITIVKQSMQTVTVSVEEIEKQEFHVEVEFNGKAADGYVPGNYSLSKNTINIKAPTSILDKIARVVAVCDLDENSSDISQKCELVLYDKRGKTVKDKNIKMSSNKVTIYVNILKEKEVPVNINSVGEPADGYYISQITLTPNTVKLVGAEEVLKDIERLDIDDNIDIAGEKKDVTKKIDLSKYLPDGVSIDGESEIQVLIEIDQLDTKTYTIKAEDIEVNNLKDGLSLNISEKSVKVTLRGEKSVMEKVSANSIKASIDLKGYGKGTSKVPLSIVIPDGTELTEQVSVKIKIK
ncbi:MAG: YbbR-like domain-containing protein [Eubacterium sp.]